MSPASKPASPYQLALALHWGLGHKAYVWSECGEPVCREARRVLVVPREPEAMGAGPKE